MTHSFRSFFPRSKKHAGQNNTGSNPPSTSGSTENEEKSQQNNGSLQTRIEDTDDPNRKKVVTVVTKFANIERDISPSGEIHENEKSLTVEASREADIKEIPDVTRGLIDGARQAIAEALPPGQGLEPLKQLADGSAASEGEDEAKGGHSS